MSSLTHDSKLKSDMRQVLFNSKRAFLRACYDLVLTQGVPPLPVAPMTGDESDKVLFVKLTSPRFGFSWCCHSDGTPIFLCRGTRVEDGVLGQNMLTTSAEVGHFLISIDVSMARSAPRDQLSTS